METITTVNGAKVWYWRDILQDLETKGCLNGLKMYHSSSPTANTAIQADYNGTVFSIKWELGKSLVLTMSKFSIKLMDAFSMTIGYLPCCSYRQNGDDIVVWDKVDPEAVIKSLQNDKAVFGLYPFLPYTKSYLP